MSEQPTERYHAVKVETPNWESRWLTFALQLSLFAFVFGIELIIILAVARLLLR